MNFDGIKTLFFDTSPVIYIVEKHELYFPLIQPIIRLIDQERITAVTSPITLAECIFYPLRSKSYFVVEEFEHFITQESAFIDINQRIGKIATEMRIAYNLKLMDALQVATAIYTNCDAFLTNDIALKRVKELRVILIEDLREA
jgi:predicted nucleic acid-binding protein